MQLSDAATIDRALAYMSSPSSSLPSASPSGSPTSPDGFIASTPRSSRRSGKGKDRAVAGDSATEEVLRFCGDLSRANVLVDTYRGTSRTLGLVQS